MIERWTEAQIEAALELDGLGHKLATPEKQELRAVSQGCICPNNHEPDKDGFIVTSPSCLLHGCRTQFIPRSRLTEFDLRTPGVIHGRKATS